MKEQRLVQRFLDYIQIDSESGKERAFADRLIADWKELGYEASEDMAGKETGASAGNLFLSISGVEGEEPLLLTAHMDTVVPGQNIRPIEKGGILYSQGDTILAGDDKSGIAAIMEAIQSLDEEGIPHRPVEILFTVQEESGLDGSKHADLSKVTARYSIAMDGCGAMDEVIVKGAGQANINVNITGLAAHAGECPDKGVSAIMAASRAISNMKLLKVDEETTANIGSLKAINPTNIVCSHLNLKAEVRSRNKEKMELQIQHMRDCLDTACKEYGASFTFEVTYPYEGFWVQDENFLNIVRHAYDQLGITCKNGVTMVGSDSNILNQKQIAAIVLPTGMTNPHALTEQLAVKDLIQTAQLVIELLRV